MNLSVATIKQFCREIENIEVYHFHKNKAISHSRSNMFLTTSEKNALLASINEISERWHSNFFIPLYAFFNPNNAELCNLNRDSDKKKHFFDKLFSPIISSFEKHFEQDYLNIINTLTHTPFTKDSAVFTYYKTIFELGTLAYSFDFHNIYWKRNISNNYDEFSLIYDYFQHPKETFSLAEKVNNFCNAVAFFVYSSTGDLLPEEQKKIYDRFLKIFLFYLHLYYFFGTGQDNEFYSNNSFRKHFHSTIKMPYFLSIDCFFPIREDKTIATAYHTFSRNMFTDRFQPIELKLLRLQHAVVNQWEKSSKKDILFPNSFIFSYYQRNIPNLYLAYFIEQAALKKELKATASLFSKKFPQAFSLLERNYIQEKLTHNANLSLRGKFFEFFTSLLSRPYFYFDEAYQEDVTKTHCALNRFFEFLLNRYETRPNDFRLVFSTLEFDFKKEIWSEDKKATHCLFCLLAERLKIASLKDEEKELCFENVFLTLLSFSEEKTRHKFSTIRELYLPVLKERVFLFNQQMMHFFRLQLTRIVYSLLPSEGKQKELLERLTFLGLSPSFLICFLL